MSMHCGRDWAHLAFCGRCGVELAARAPKISEARAAITPALARGPQGAFAEGQRDDDAETGASTDFAFGITGIAIGLGVTAATYGAADPGGTFIIFWGPAVYGAWRIVCGLFKLARA